MTREEAIICLQGLLENPLINKGSYLAQAIEMAIQSLSQEPCEDAISREAVINLIRGCNNALEEPRIFDCHNAGVEFEQYITELPSVTQKSGKWIWCVGSHKCSNCEEYTCFSHKELLKYCPNCGAKMESEDKE